MRRLKSLFLGLWLIALAALGSGLALVTGAGSDENERGVLASLISKMLSGPGMSVSIGAVDGALSSDATIRDVVIADANGPWLKLDRARIIWTRSALLTGRLHVDRLEVGRLDILRRPLPSTAPASDGPLLPELPVKVEIGAFQLADLALGPDVAGAAAHLAAEGRAKLGKPSEGLDARFDIRRLDAPGTIGLTLAYVPKSLALRFRLAAEEPPGGIVARLARIPDLPGLHLDLSGDGTLDALNANLALAAGPELAAAGSATLLRAGTARQLRLDANGHFGGLLPADWAPIFGGDMRLAGQMALADAGGLTLDSLSLSGAGTELAAKGTLTAQDELAGQVSLQVTDIAHFRALAGRDLRGALVLSADVSGQPFQQRVDARLTLAATNLQTGLPLLDDLTGGRVDVRGGLGLRPGGGFALSGFEARGRSLSLTASGDGSAAKSDLRLALQLPDVSRAAPQLTGQGDAALHLTGALAQPKIDVTARLTRGSALGRPVPALSLTGSLSDPLGALQADARLDGTIGAARATGGLKLARAQAGAWSLATQDLALGSARVVADVTVGPEGLARGRLNLDVPDLDQLSPLALQKLDGTLRADVDLTVTQGRQGAVIAARAAKLRLPGATLEAADMRARVADLLGAAAVDGTLDVSRLSAAGESVERLKLTSKAVGAASDLTVAGQVRGMALEAAARLSMGGDTHLALSRLTAQRGGQRIALAGPATVDMGESGVTVRGLALEAGGGRISVDGKVSPSFDLRLAAKAVPLSLAGLLKPELGLAGTLDAQATVTGTAAAPAGAWDVKLVRLQAAALRGAGTPPLDVTASGRLAGGQTSLQGVLSLGKGGQVTLSGDVPLDGSARLDLSIKGQIDAALANAALAADGRTLAGRVAVDARAAGSLTAPRLAGSATLSGGSFEDPLNGLKLSRIEARLRGAGEEVTIEQASAVARNGGTLSAAGRVRLSPGAGFPATLHITAKEAELVSNPIVTAIADLALDLSGPLAQRPRVTGRASIREMDVRIPQRMPFANRPLAGAVHVKPTKMARERLAMERKRAAQTARSPAFEADLDLLVSAPARIYVRGRGVDAELGGDLRLTGTLGRPTAIGAFELRRGKLDVAGQRLDFTRGKVDFAGDVMPNLDFVAETTASDVTAQVSVSGPASKPVFAFTSTPSLPQDEVISRLLFARASGSLSPVQAIQLAQTVAELSGDGGAGTLDRVRRSLGVDTLDVGVDASGKASVGASRYISRNTRVGVRTGTKPEDSAVTLGVDLTRRLRAQGEVGADGKASVGLGFEWDY